MTRVMPRCEEHKFPILECSDCAPTPDDLLDIAHEERHLTADELAALAGAVIGAVIGGGVMLVVGVIDYLLGKRRP